jgi:hypothetical protein
VSGHAAGGSADHLHVEVARESVTMALYQSLSLLAVLLATPTPDEGGETGAQVALTVLLTGLGLLAAHHMAFRMSSRLVNSGALSDDSLRLLRAQALGGLPVVVLAAVPPLAFGTQWGSLVSEVLLLGIVALVGYRAARQGTTRGRALIYVAVILGIAAAVIALKLAVGH